ncbi:MAG: 16S rRNA processing protein RimM [Clostridia bacterium]|nr:16S rRNA processing protein RimM [Clostridia bacterium]
MNKYLECAAVAGTHGVRGMMKLKSLCNASEDLLALKKIYTKEKDGSMREWRVTGAFVHKGFVVTSVEGIDDLDRAAAMKGTVFFADRESFDLEEGDFFIADVIGLPVVDEERGAAVGTLSDVMTDRIQHIYVVKTERGGEFMIPGVPEFIKKVVPDGDGAGIYVHLIDGMTDGGGEEK